MLLTTQQDFIIPNCWPII